MHNNITPVENDDIALKDVIGFAKRCWFVVSLWGVAGMLCVATYIVATPNKYEASWSLQMAYFFSNKANSNSEEVEALIQRLSIPTTYSDAVLVACEIPIKAEVAEYLNGSLIVKAVKNVPSVVTMKLRSINPDTIETCAYAIVGMIEQQQRELIEKHLAGRQEQLAQYLATLQDEQQKLEKLEKSAIFNTAYLMRQDKLNGLRERIDQLQAELFLSQKHPTKLLAPIHVSSKPVSPRVGLLLLIGFMVGFMAGVLYAFVRDSRCTQPKQV